MKSLMNTRKLRIFYAAHDKATNQVEGSLIWYYNLYLPLVDLGYDVVRLEYDLARYKQIIEGNSENKSPDFIHQTQQLFEEELLRQIKLAHNTNPIDMFFSYFSSRIVSPAIIEEIKQLGIVTVNWYCNGSYQFHLVEKIAPVYDYSLVPEKFRLPDYKRIGANPIYCQEAANPNVYKPYDLPLSYDVTFVGQKYGDRPEYIRYLLDHEIDVNVWGPYWQGGGPTIPLWRKVGSRVKRFLHGTESLFPTKIPAGKTGPPLSDDQLIQMYSRSRISLGFSSVADTTIEIKQVRLRDFEAPMSGAFYMVEYMEELEEFFHIGKEIVCYYDKKDLADKIKYYLSHEQEREIIRQAGMDRARRDHTWQRRFQYCFSQMDELN